ncbi:MAG TPA: rRNA maturation RNase YbeY, partial [Methylomirabilota bacterium]|nr:rRNA maturation RNase YbeY [Methylomirabilota bacterium]
WGEVIVSAETAARQARRLRVSLATELDLLVVHGVLHLAGYDDHDPRRARRMHERARKILSGRSARAVPARLWAGLLEA